MFKYILFDLDGTITDSQEGITKSAQYALKCVGVEENDLSKLIRFIGPPIKYSFMTFYGLSEEQAEYGLKKYRERYEPIGIYENSLLEGAEELFSALKKANKKIALATSKPQPFAEAILKHFGVYDYFDFVNGADMSDKKSKTGIIDGCIRYFGGNRGEYLMVGDRNYDVLGSRDNGIACVGVKFFGYAERLELERAGAAFIIDRVEDLKKLILRS